jgi:hypothetical protein
MHMFRGIVPTILVVIMLAFVITPNLASATEKKLITFKLEDRKGVQRTEKEFKGKSFILVASDKGGSKYNDAWMQKIQTGLKDREDAKPSTVMAIADLSAVPSLMRGAVRRILPKADKVNLILDWEGIFAKAYGFEENKTNLLIFSNSGALLFQEAVTKLDTKKADSIIEMLAKEQQTEK